MTFTAHWRGGAPIGWSVTSQELYVTLANAGLERLTKNIGGRQFFLKEWVCALYLVAKEASFASDLEGRGMGWRLHMLPTLWLSLVRFVSRDPDERFDAVVSLVSLAGIEEASRRTDDWTLEELGSSVRWSPSR